MNKSTTAIAFLPRPSTMEVDAQCEHAAKQAIDAVAYRLGFFREYDEPNETFSARLDAFLCQLRQGARDE